MVHLLRITTTILGLLAAYGSPGLFAQIPSTVGAIRQFSYEQTGSDTITDYQPSILYSVTFQGIPPTSTEVSVQSPSGSFTLQRNPVQDPAPGQPTRTVYSYTQKYSSNAALDAALLTGSTTFLVRNIDRGTSYQYPNAIFVPAQPSTMRFSNYNALQSWDGGDFVVSWQPFTTNLTRQFYITRPDGTYATQFSGLTGPSPMASLSQNAQSISVQSFSSNIGDIFYGTITASDSTRLVPASSVETSPLFDSTTTLRVPVRRQSLPPVIVAQPKGESATIGSTVALSVTATGDNLAYSWKKDGITIAGATSASLTLTNVKATDAGSYTVNVTNSGGSVTSNAATLTVVAPTVAPVIPAAPRSATVLAGTKTSLGFTAIGTPPLTYQWSRNGTALPGATFEILTLDTTLLADAGSYTVTITNSAGSTTSPAITLSVTPISRISNLSVLTSLADPTDNFTLGYVIGGANTTGAKPLVLRAAGPALAALGVGGTLDDPKLETYAGATKTGENDNWGASTSPALALTSAFTAVGAFPFASPTSRDAAVANSITARDNSVKISAANSSTGLVLAEVYDATPTDTFTTATPRLLNVSVLKSLGTGLTVGFTLAGSTPKTVLIRAIGPTLGDFGVPGTVADPQLVLFNSTSVKLAENDNWAVPVASAPNAAALTAAFTAVGAFALPATSKDAALLTTLPPGGYSVQVSGVNNTTGAALVEVYEVP